MSYKYILSMPNLSLIPATSLKKQRLTTDQTALSHLKVGSNAHKIILHKIEQNKQMVNSGH